MDPQSIEAFAPRCNIALYAPVPPAQGKVNTTKVSLRSKLTLTAALVVIVISSKSIFH